jgi:hypothetical protein
MKNMLVFFSEFPHEVVYFILESTVVTDKFYVCSTGFLVLGFCVLLPDTRHESAELFRAPLSGRTSAAWKPSVLQVRMDV